MGDVLFLAHRIPYPPDKGDKIRSWNILKHITARARVHLGAFVDSPEDMMYEEKLSSVCKSVKLLPIEARGRLQRVLGGLQRDLPLSIALYEDKRMRRWVWECIKAYDIDRIFVFSGQMAPYALGHTSEDRRIVMDFVDVDSEKFAQYARESRWPKSWIYAREARLLGAYEKQVARHVGVSLFVSDAETALFKRLAGSYAHSVQTLHNGVDLEYFSPDASFGSVTLDGAPALVFTGAMDYRPNADAVIWFSNEVLPLVRKTWPGTVFHIVGSKPGREVKALAQHTAIRVTGRVDDVRPYLAAADMVVAPLRIARGVQNKVLEAMAMARPVIATTAAWSGIDAQPGRDLLVCDTPDDIAAAISDVVAKALPGELLGSMARRRVEQRYAWPAQLAKLDEWLDLANVKDVAA